MSKLAACSCLALAPGSIPVIQSRRPRTGGFVLDLADLSNTTLTVLRAFAEGWTCDAKPLPPRGLFGEIQAATLTDLRAMVADDVKRGINPCDTLGVGSIRDWMAKYGPKWPGEKRLETVRQK